MRPRDSSESAWSDIDVQLERRGDRVPNLVETVKGHAQHEQGAFGQVTEIRSRAVAAGGPAERPDDPDSAGSAAAARRLPERVRLRDLC